MRCFIQLVKTCCIVSRPVALYLTGAPCQPCILCSTTTYRIISHLFARGQHWLSPTWHKSTVSTTARQSLLIHCNTMKLKQLLTLNFRYIHVIMYICILVYGYDSNYYVRNSQFKSVRIKIGPYTSEESFCKNGPCSEIYLSLDIIFFRQILKYLISYIYT